MKPQEDKENAVWVEESVPTTPTHLLSRSQSLVKNRSPKKVGPRRPLASKDNNKANSFSFKKSTTNQPVRKKSRPLVSHTGSFISNTRPSQGPVINNNGVPKIKSLVLKDTAEEDEESQSDEEEANPLAAKLRNAMSHGQKSTEDDEQGGLLGIQGGLQGLIGSRKLGEESDSDMEVETIPPAPKPLPHIPNGYTPFDEEDIIKLHTFTSPFAWDEDETDEQPDSHPKFLPIDVNNDENESSNDEGPFNASNTTRIFPVGDAEDSLELDSRYYGKGLTSEELESLLD
ncbi:LAFE_0H09384g1_1 [Lachancea fermentati]|uniref:LAFE_0H09384g1_1 n=1 Tax=Lachancea fermentati TaxID=4955 RepID=A0A1G4MK39_LACFM|nr:LAFE_0H09384g1_1 [Lachancea fermentati]